MSNAMTEALKKVKEKKAGVQGETTGSLEARLPPEGGLTVTMTAPAANGTAPLIPPKPDKKEPHPESLLHRCGHHVGVRHYTNGDCPACKSANRQAKAKKKRDEQEAGKKQKPKLDDDGRLPDGAIFSAIYEAATQIWTVALQIGEVNMKATGSSVEKTMRELAWKWRERTC